MKNVRTSRSVPHTEYFPQAGTPGQPGRLLAVVQRDVREMVHFWPVVQNMVAQELRVRYHRSVLGFLWTLINPIMMMATLTMVFSQVFNRPDWKGYAIYLFAGQVPWTMFGGSLNDCSNCILANEGLIRKIYLPKLVFPVSKVLLNLTTFVLSLTALYLLMGLLGAKVTPAMIMLPVVIALFTLFALGLGLILAVTNTFYRDTGHVITVVLQAWYFATPIIWGDDGIKASLAAKCWLNPAFSFIKMFQLIICDGQWPTLTLFLVATGFTAVSLGIGYVIFKSHEDKLVFRL